LLVPLTGRNSLWQLTLEKRSGRWQAFTPVAFQAALLTANQGRSSQFFTGAGLAYYWLVTTALLGLSWQTHSEQH
jgi:hypothetical protein